MCACVCSYLDVLRDLVSALLMTSEGADCRLWAKVFIFYTVREREWRERGKRGERGHWKRWLKVMVGTIFFFFGLHETPCVYGKG